MDLDKIKETDIWTLYDQSVSYCRLINMFEDTDINYRMYNGDQWYGLKVQGVEKVQYNFIKPIVKYKTGIILTNYYSPCFSSENFENKEFRTYADKICKLLKKKAAKIWEKDYMDLKLRLVVKDAAINDEGIVYVYYSKDAKSPINEVLNKNDVFYANENNEDIQSQPYILVKQRKPVSEVKQIAKDLGVSKENINLIQGDMQTLEEAGEQAKYEKDNMCTLVTKFYKTNGTVHMAKATRSVDILKDTDLGLTYYPIAHLPWEYLKGSARGEGEVRYLIPNQIETNKTAMRRALAVKNTAYPQKIANISKISNPGAINDVGATIKTFGMSVDDVRKVFSHIDPAQMSPDVEKLQNELIQSTRELAGAGEIATGEINPEQASGRAILAIQQAAQQPLTEHLEYTKGFIEDLARIWLDMLIVYNDTVELEEEIEDPVSGETTTQIITVLKDTLKELQATVKVDVTPRSAYDKYAQELSLENLLTNGFFNSSKMPELKLYVKTLDDDSAMPKQKLLDLIAEWDKEQAKINKINAQAQLMQQNVEQFLNGDIESQAGMIQDNASIQNPIAEEDLNLEQ